VASRVSRPGGPRRQGGGALEEGKELTPTQQEAQQ
jgi:hypothetical protein